MNVFRVLSTRSVQIHTYTNASELVLGFSFPPCIKIRKQTKNMKKNEKKSYFRLRKYTKGALLVHSLRWFSFHSYCVEKCQNIKLQRNVEVIYSGGFFTYERGLHAGGYQNYLKLWTSKLWWIEHPRPRPREFRAYKLHSLGLCKVRVGIFEEWPDRMYSLIHWWTSQTKLFISQGSKAIKRQE